MIPALELALSFSAIVVLGGPYLGAYALANVGDYFARRRYGLARRTR